MNVHQSVYQKINAVSFVKMLAANVANGSMSDEAFREMVRNTLPVVEGGDLSSITTPKQKTVLTE